MLAGTGLATRALALRSAHRVPATLAGCAALFSGYALFTAYERTAFAELTGGIWIPLLLLFALRDRNHPRCPSLVAPSMAQRFRSRLSSRAPGFRTASSASWPATFSQRVALIWRLSRRSWAPVLRGASGPLLGMGLAAFYLAARDVGAAMGRHSPGRPTTPARASKTAGCLRVTPTPPGIARPGAPPGFHHRRDHDCRGACGLLVCWLRGRSRNVAPAPRWWIPLALIPVVVLLLQFPFSRPLWNLLPECASCSFPGAGLWSLRRRWRSSLSAAIWPRNSPRLGALAVLPPALRYLSAMTCVAGLSTFRFATRKTPSPAWWTSYRSGQALKGPTNMNPPGADNSLVATGLPDCLPGERSRDRVWAAGSR